MLLKLVNLLIAKTPKKVVILLQSLLTENDEALLTENDEPITT